MRFLPRAAASHLKCFTTLVKYTFVAPDPGLFQRLAQKFSCGSNKRMSCAVFLISGLFADQHDLRFRRAFPKNRLRRILPQIASPAFTSGDAQRADSP